MSELPDYYPDKHSLDAPLGLEKVEAALRERMSDGTAMGITAQIMEWHIAEMTRYAAEVRAAALSDAAKVAEPLLKLSADAIRALLKKEPTP